MSVFEGELHAVLQEFFDEPPDLVYIKNGNGQWIWANHAVLKIFQLSGVDYRGLCESQLIEYTPFYQDELLNQAQVDEQVWLSGEIEEREEVISHPEQKIQILKIVRIPSFGINGNRRLLVVWGRDVSHYIPNVLLEEANVETRQDSLESPVSYDNLLSRSVDEIRFALKNNELRVFYQPIVNVYGHVTGAEALVRWQHPVAGIVLPGDFIRLAEDSGLIIPIGEWVLRTTFEHIREMHTSGQRDFRVFVNISPRQFRDEQFLERFEAIIMETGVNSDWIGIEVTEGSIIHDASLVQRTLTALQSLGITVSIDDFGTGYSSLNRLSRLPVDKLKIDKSFVDEISTNNADVSIVKAIIQLAKNLGISTVAEGIELEEQLQILAHHGCEEFQGYFFARPMPKDEFLLFLDMVMQNKEKFTTPKGFSHQHDN